MRIALALISPLDELETSVDESIEEVTSTVESAASGAMAILAPNYSSKVSISSGYTATKYGWVDWGVAQGGLYYSNGNGFYVNGIKLAVCFNTYGDRVGGGNAFVMVSHGDVVTWTKSYWAYFIPCKGA